MGVEGGDVELPDVSKLPGAHVVTAIGLRSGTIALRYGCVRAPSDRFVPGVESVLFERATALALRAAHETPSELGRTRGSSDETGGLYTEELEGRARDRKIAVAHALTFVGDDRDALLCTVVCSEDERDATCSRAVATLRVVGAHAPPPKPGIVSRAAFFAADHPTVALGGGALVVGLVVAWILRARPRGKP